MDIEIDGDLITLNGFLVARIELELPASIRGEFEDFLRWAISESESPDP